MAECIHQCLDCKTTFPRKDSFCPNCGSQNFQDLLVVIVNIQPTIRSGIKVKVGDKKTGITYMQISREEKGRDGKEAKNTMIFDFEKDRYTHSVKKQDASGTWVETHSDDEPLSEHNKKAMQKNKQSKP